MTRMTAQPSTLPAAFRGPACAALLLLSRLWACRRPARPLRGIV